MLRNFPKTKPPAQFEAGFETQIVLIAKAPSILPFDFLFSRVENSVFPSVFHLSICEI